MEFRQEIHSDIWGPTKHLTLGGRKYFISFTNDCCQWTTVFTLTTKKIPEVLACLKSFEAWVLTQLKVIIECLQTNCGTEYLSGIFEEYLDSKGIQLKLTIHHTPEEDGISKWLNCTLIEKVCAMLIASRLPIFLWGEALFYACYLKN